MSALYLGIEVALLNRKKFFRFGSFQISISRSRGSTVGGAAGSG